jgi:phosphatidylglycerophosphate synthase
MAHRFTLDEIRTRTYKRRDAWWTVWFVDPVASRLVRLVAPWRWMTPNLITTFAFLLGVAAAAAFWQASYGWLVAGAVLFHLSFVLDCMDGKIARLNGTGSVFGAWLDYVFDRLRVVACAIGLFGGQYERTGDFAYIWLAGLVIFLDLFRYLNALQMSKVRNDMKAGLAAARGEVPGQVKFVEETASEQPAAAVNNPDDIFGDFRERFGLFIRFRNALIRQRIRAHVFSGIEFMMFVFIVGPVVGGVIGVTLVSSALLGAFELLLIYKLYTATKTYARKVAAATAVVPSQAAGPATGATIAPQTV